MKAHELARELLNGPDEEVTVECMSEGDGAFNHSVMVNGDLVASWDLED